MDFNNGTASNESWWSSDDDVIDAAREREKYIYIVVFSRGSIGNNFRFVSAPNVSEFSAVFDCCEKLNQNISGKPSYHAQKSIAGKMYDVQSVKYLNYTYCILYNILYFGPDITLKCNIIWRFSILCIYTYLWFYMQRCVLFFKIGTNVNFNLILLKWDANKSFRILKIVQSHIR